jgi:hypothetical protein
MIVVIVNNIIASLNFVAIIILYCFTITTFNKNFLKNLFFNCFILNNFNLNFKANSINYNFDCPIIIKNFMEKIYWVITNKLIKFIEASLGSIKLVLD